MKAVLMLLLIASPSLADHCRVVQQQAVVQNQVAVVPFVAPLGVVIPGSPFYSYRGAVESYQHAGAASYGVQAQSADAKLFEEFLAWKKGREANQVTAAVVPQTLLQQNCVKCHTEKPDAKAALDMSEPLYDAGKLASIKAIMLGKMPKAKVLDPQVRSDIVAELSGVSK